MLARWTLEEASPESDESSWNSVNVTESLLVLLSHVFVGTGHDFAHGDAGLDIL